MSAKLFIDREDLDDNRHVELTIYLTEPDDDGIPPAVWLRDLAVLGWLGMQLEPWLGLARQQHRCRTLWHDCKHASSSPERDDDTCRVKQSIAYGTVQLWLYVPKGRPSIEEWTLRIGALFGDALKVAIQ